MKHTMHLEGRGFDLQNKANFIIVQFVFTKLEVNGRHCVETFGDEFREETVSKAIRVKIALAEGEGGTKRFPRQPVISRNV